MAVTVKIPTPLRRMTGGMSQVQVEADSIADCVKLLEQEYPGIGARLADEKGELRRFVNIYVNGEDVRFLNGAATALKSGDEISIIPAMAGGR